MACELLNMGEVMSMEVRAKALGWERRYAASEDFRSSFAEMYEAVKQLPPGLIERGRSYDYPQLHRACLDGDIELVKGLVANGLDANAYTYTEDEDDQPPLVWLAEDQTMDPKLKVQMANLLLASGADVDEGDALVAAEDAGDNAFAKFLRKAGATN